MSKIGKRKILLTKLNKISIDDRNITIFGPLGSLSVKLFKFLSVIREDNYLFLNINNLSSKNFSFLGLFRTLINNMTLGVNRGYMRRIEINGTGYKVYHNSNFLVFILGYSHDVIYHIPKNILIKCIANKIEVFGCDKYLISRVCSDIINLRKLERYKGKGIKYSDERFLKKIGKKK